MPISINLKTLGEYIQNISPSPVFTAGEVKH